MSCAKGTIANFWSGMSVSIQELDNTVQAFYEGKGDLVGKFPFDSKRVYLFFDSVM